MKIAITGGTGFIGRYIVSLLAQGGHECRLWYRPTSNREGFDDLAQPLQWIAGDLSQPETVEPLVAGCDAVVHGAVWSPGKTFQGGEGDLVKYLQVNLLGTIALIEAAGAAGVGRFIYISSCAVHDEILDDRALDEKHPLWPRSHYGAHKAAIEKFVHSFGLGHDYPICALRPTGVYGVNRPIETSKWYDLVQAVARGESVQCQRGGKEVHAADAACAVELLLSAPGISGQAFNCYDRYISQYEVATIAKKITGSQAEIVGRQTRPKHEIQNDKIRELGLTFGGQELLEETIRQMLESVG